MREKSVRREPVWNAHHSVLDTEWGENNCGFRILPQYYPKSRDQNRK